MEATVLSMPERVTKLETRLDNIEARLDRAARMFFFAGSGLFALAAAVVGALIAG